MFKNRINTLRSKLKESNIDVALITDDDNVYYYTGYYDYLHMEFGRPTILIVPKEDKKKKKIREKENAPVKKGAKPAAKINKDKIVIEELTKQLTNVEDKQLRLKAEFENFRKRKEKEIMDLIRYEGKDVIKAMISVVDDLERLYSAVENNDDLDQSLKEGMALIQSKVEKIFLELDVASFGEVGDLLDSELHDALMVRQEEEKNDNEIIEVFEKGYKYRDRVIRHAKVVVNKT